MIKSVLLFVLLCDINALISICLPIYMAPVRDEIFISFEQTNDSNQQQQPDRAIVKRIRTPRLVPEIDNHLQFGFSYKLKFSDTANTFFPIEFDTNYSENDSLSIFCFRGNQERSAPSRGFVNGVPESLRVKWEFKTHYDTTKTQFGTWGGGAGWTGQPLLIHWNREQKEKSGITDTAFLNNPNALEIISGSLGGEIYFIDLQTGKSTRPALGIENPIKGTVSVDPRKNGLLYVGQGVKRKDSSRFGAYVFDMFNRKEVLYIPGIDAFSVRKWGAFDSNPLIEKESGFVFWPGENGLVYRFKFDDSLKVESMSKLQYNHKKMFRQGIESSMTVKNKYGFIADNSVIIMCINLQTMQPVWNMDNFDDTDATLLFEAENDSSWYVYSGNEVDIRVPSHTAEFRKINAITGQEVWSQTVTCYGTDLNGKTNSGGILASPVLGKQKGKNLVYNVFARINKQNKGLLLAVDKHSGKEVFTFELKDYSWASPVDFYDESGNIYLFLTDVSGGMYILDGQTGKLLSYQKLDLTLETSPIIINNTIILPSRGNSVFCIEIVCKAK